MLWSLPQAVKSKELGSPGIGKLSSALGPPRRPGSCHLVSNNSQTKWHDPLPLLLVASTWLPLNTALLSTPQVAATDKTNVTRAAPGQTEEGPLCPAS